MKIAEKCLDIREKELSSFNGEHPEIANCFGLSKHLIIYFKLVKSSLP